MLEVRDLRKSFGRIVAVDGVSFRVGAGEAIGPDLFDTVVMVDIEGDNVDDELLENVGKLHGVEWFTIQGHAAPDLTPAGMAQLRTLSRLKGLSVRGFTDSHGFVASLTGKTWLRRLSLPETVVTDDEMAIIGGIRLPE